MTEPTHEQLDAVDADLQDILEAIAFRYVRNDLPEARARLRRRLAESWDDGYIVGLSPAQDGAGGVPNPWRRPELAPAGDAGPDNEVTEFGQSARNTK